MALAIGAKLFRFQIKNPDKTGMPHQANRPVNIFVIGQAYQKLCFRISEFVLISANMHVMPSLGATALIPVTPILGHMLLFHQSRLLQVGFPRPT